MNEIITWADFQALRKMGLWDAVKEVRDLLQRPDCTFEVVPIGTIAAHREELLKEHPELVDLL